MMTLGEKLKKIRSEKRISLNEVSKNTKIQLKYLEYLEEGAYEKLPADVYIKGFLRSYVQYVGGQELLFLKLYERERDINKNIQKTNQKESWIKPINFSSIKITPKWFLLILILLLVFGGFYYLYQKANIFISTPRLMITEPGDGAEIDGNEIRISGITDRDAQLLVNEKAILVDAEGKFTELVGLHEGLNLVVIKSTNRFQKETSQIISIKSNYKNGVENSDIQNTNQNETKSEETISETEKIKLEISINPHPTWISVEADGMVLFSGIFSPGTSKTFESKGDIRVSSDRGNNTYIKINGKDKGTLGSDSGIVKDIIFNVSSK